MTSFALLNCLKERNSALNNPSIRYPLVQVREDLKNDTMRVENFKPRGGSTARQTTVRSTKC